SDPVYCSSDLILIMLNTKTARAQPDTEKKKFLKTVPKTAKVVCSTPRTFSSFASIPTQNRSRKSQTDDPPGDPASRSLKRDAQSRLVRLRPFHRNSWLLNCSLRRICRTSQRDPHLVSTTAVINLTSWSRLIKQHSATLPSTLTRSSTTKTITSAVQ
ncbi:hypothetical protein RvY_03126-1, partial [Ramazzottius varieornatus]